MNLDERDRMPVMDEHEEREWWRKQASRSTQALECACSQLGRIADILESALSSEVTDFQLSQLQGDSAMAITGTVVGTTSTFNIGLVPATNFVPLTSGPSVTVDDPNVTLTPVDASNDFTASVAATDTGASYNLTISGVNGAGTAITHTFNIPILPAAPPPPVQVTDFSLNQLS